MAVLATVYVVLCSLSLRITSLFFMKEMASFLSSLLYNKYGASWLYQNQVKCFKILLQYIPSNNFFLNDSHGMCEQKTKNDEYHIYQFIPLYAFLYKTSVKQTWRRTKAIAEIKSDIEQR